MEILEQIGLTRADGTPLTGLPNLAGEAGMAYADEEPVDLQGNPLELDPLGADLEGIVRAEDGTYWMVDEYRPAIYHFAADGVLIARYVPEGSNNEETGIAVGEEAIPAIYAQRRANRGFEAVALRDGILYAFIQSPIDNPDGGKDSSSKAATLVRILAFDTAAGQTVGEYFYRLDGDGVDKIGDAVAMADGTFLVHGARRRDGRRGAQARLPHRHRRGDQLPGIRSARGRGTAERRRPGRSWASRRSPRRSIVDLGAIGYDTVDKPEGLALIDENTLAVINDNDFGTGGNFDPATGLIEENPNPTPVVLGIVHLASNGLDASDKDGGINIAALAGAWACTCRTPSPPTPSTARPTWSRPTRATPATTTATAKKSGWATWCSTPRSSPTRPTLQREENLGRLRVSTASTDTDGDGLVDRIAAYGGRSFSIWDTAGNLVFDSGDAIERITAELLPDGFNSSGENDTFDERSDDKGPEPEAVALGEIDGRTYAFVGLERIGGIMVWDITDPQGAGLRAICQQSRLRRRRRGSRRPGARGHRLRAGGRESHGPARCCSSPTSSAGRRRCGMLW